MDSFGAFGRSVLNDYVRSALIVDDRWPEDSPSGVDQAVGIDPGLEMDEGFIVDVQEPSEALPRPSAPADVDAYMLCQLQTELVRRGIITCGFRYEQTARSIVIELAKRSDIIVLDWNLAGDDGAEAVEILRRLRGHSMRFVCIWTGQGRVEDILERLAREIGAIEKGRQRARTVPHETGLRIGNLVITIRRKEGLEEDTKFSVKPADFLDIALDGLLESFGGLVRLAILEMTTRHRDHLPEILDALGDSMDAAVLLEAGDQSSSLRPGGALLSVLVDEWRARLERDSAQLKALGGPGRRAFGARVRAQRQRDWEERVVDFLVLHGADRASARRDAQTLAPSLDSWLESACEAPLPEGLKVSRRMLACAALLAAFREESTSDPLLRLDALLHQQFNSPLALTQGTLVVAQAGESEQYLLCTTPACDAERPEKIGRLFTFARCRVVPVADIFKVGGVENYCIVMQEDEPLCLEVLIKQRVSICVDNSRFENGSIAGHFSFVGEASAKQGIELRCIAQLRAEHALSLAAAGAADAARIGVSRGETIRSRMNRRTRTD